MRGYHITKIIKIYYIFMDFKGLSNHQYVLVLIFTYSKK